MILLDNFELNYSKNLKDYNLYYSEDIILE